MTQAEAIRQYIDEKGSISPMEAFYDLGITKLATRISEMKRKGENFKTTYVKHETKYGRTVVYARYSKEDKA